MHILDKLRGEYNSLQTQIREMDEDFASRDSEPSEAEQENYRALNDEMEAIVPRIEVASAQAQRMAKGAELLNAVPAGLTSKLDSSHSRGIGTEISTWGEWARALANGEIDPDVVADYKRAVVANELGRDHRRALADVVTGDVPGITPPAWLRDIVDFIGTARPFVTAFSRIPLPDSGMTVNYPRVTQRPVTGEQLVQKTEIPSGKTLISSEVATVRTFGGGEDTSIAVLQRTDPGYLSIMMELYAEELAVDMDVAAITEALAEIPAPNTIALTTPALVNKVLASGAAMVLRARAVPNRMVIGLGIWEFLAGASDTDGRPLFPNIGPSNPVGSIDITGSDGNARGITVVADPNMGDDDGVLGWDRAFTTMVSGTQTLSADVPSRLGRDHAVFEFGAFAVRRPDALVRITGPTTTTASTSSAKSK